MERNEIITETGERKADGSVRFSSHAACNPMAGCMEMVHNLITYGKNKGRIVIEPRGGNVCNYRFYNNAESDKLPSFGRIKMIAATAGKSISANEGVSLCGIGTEVMGLSSRPHADSTVTGHITVVRDGLTYGVILIFDGSKQEISYQIIPPMESNDENSYDVVFKNCKPLTTKEINLLKKRIADTMPKGQMKIIFETEDEKCVLTHEDFLYRDKLIGTENYEKHSFYTENGKPILTLEIADVQEIVKSGNGNVYEAHDCKKQPELSGGAFRYHGIATICRGDMGWAFVGLSPHNTKNNIRFDIEGSDYIFHELHRESQVKTETTLKLCEIKDECRDTMKIYDENGNEFDISEVQSRIIKFCNTHKTDKNSEINIENSKSALIAALMNGYVTIEELDACFKVLSYSSGTITTKIFSSEVLTPITKKMVCYSNAQ